MVETTEESRRAKRIDLHIPVRLTRQPDPSPGKSFFISALTQLSPDGAFVKTSASYQKGSMIAMDFELPTKSAEIFHVHALGRVAWEGNPTVHESASVLQDSPHMGIGIQFVLMTQEEKKQIGEFMDLHKNPQEKPARCL